MKESTSDLALLIAEEKRLAANEYQAEVWTDGMSNGIEPEILAEAAFVTALQYLLHSKSEDEALLLVDSVRERIIMGEFSAHKTIQ